ncbi:MAG: hypothetical protein NTX53_03400 [candidate division WOR-3 bacterium]|nr:hypothetical protein [candidate division WOR-3 bacterium]
MTSKPLSLKPHQAAVAFLDILGFSSMRPEAAFRAMEAVRALRPPDNNPGWKLGFHAFADSFILDVPLWSQNPVSTLQITCIQVNRMLKALVRDHDLLASGGISYGEVWQEGDQEMMLGTAVAKAHAVEKRWAFVPRVVVDPDVIPAAWSRLNNKGRALPILCLSDNVPFIDYLHHPGPPMGIGSPDGNWVEYVRLLEGSRRVLTGLAKTATAPERLAKCAWAVWYHNRSVRKAMWDCRQERAKLEGLLTGERDTTVLGRVDALKEVQRQPLEKRDMTDALPGGRADTPPLTIR